MDAAELHARIADGENLRTDFKEALGSSNELAKDLVCFANTDGGVILVGVTDDRTIVGVEEVHAIHQMVDNVAYNNCEPPVTVVQETVEVGEKTVVVIHVAKGSQRPYRTNRGRYYVRTTSGCRDAAREELLRLFQAAETLYYDETPFLKLETDALSFDAVEKYLERTGLQYLDSDRERLLRNWGLLEGAHPTLAGLLLFGDAPQDHLPFAQVNAAVFPGVDASEEPIDRKDLRGRLLDLLEDCERFLTIHLRTPHRIRGFEPERYPELPMEALREAMVNAVAHRDYTIQGPIRLFVHPDRIELHTPGRPPNSVNATAMRAGVHVPRNPRIYSRLSDAGMVTGAGTGIRRIIRLVREATGQDVEIVVHEYEVLFVIPRAASTTPG